MTVDERSGRATGVAFVIYYSLIQTLGALKAASVYYIPPVVALATGAIFAGESVGLKRIAGDLEVAASHQAPEIKETRMCGEPTAAFGSSDLRLKRQDLGAQRRFRHSVPVCK